VLIVDTALFFHDGFCMERTTVRVRCLERAGDDERAAK
jgi:hypothetical protein